MRFPGWGYIKCSAELNKKSETFLKTWLWVHGIGEHVAALAYKKVSPLCPCCLSCSGVRFRVWLLRLDAGSHRQLWLEAELWWNAYQWYRTVDWPHHWHSTRSENKDVAVTFSITVTRDMAAVNSNSHSITNCKCLGAHSIMQNIWRNWGL